MNFLLHRHLAARDVGSALAGAAATLPDLWRIADRRARAQAAVEAPADEPGAAAAAGIAHHLASDERFHRGGVFRDGERLTGERLRQAVRVPRIGLFAHAAWELCLDGALVRRVGAGAIRGGLAEGFAAMAGVEDACLRAHVPSSCDWKPDERARFATHMGRIRGALLDDDWVDRHATGPGIAQMISRLRQRVGLPPVPIEDLPALGAALDGLTADADAGLERLLAD